ncbi:MAG: hypothetical protein EOM11_10450 [Erysipelotrichia bacterium]|nr:hypothetical protein [Erysipelotrichia bacterium]
MGELANVKNELVKVNYSVHFPVGVKDCRFCGGEKAMVKTGLIKKTFSKSSYEFEGYVCTCCGGCEIVQKI